MSRKKIVFINQDSGYLMIDIINLYSSEGYDCVLITGRLNVRNTPLNSNVSLERIIKYRRATKFGRIATWTIGFLQIWFKVILHHRRDELFIVSNPPFAPLLGLHVKNPFKLLIFDVYPEALSELGYLPDRSVIMRCWRLANKKAYAKAGDIFTISQSMKDILISYASNKQIKVVPVWTDNSYLKPVRSAENLFIKRHGLAGKFVVLYSGNIGLSGDVDVLVDIAAAVKRSDIAFLIIGDGAKRMLISKRVNALNLRNVTMLPWQMPSELPYSLSSAHLAVVSLGAKASKLAIPSKLVNYLSVGAPLLCLTSEGSEVERLVTKYECGRSYEPHDISGIMKFIIEIADNKKLWEGMSINSLKASLDFNASNARMFLT